MWIYEKRLQYPIKITRPNPGLAKIIAAQYGGPKIRKLSEKPSRPPKRPGGLPSFY